MPYPASRRLLCLAVVTAAAALAAPAAALAAPRVDRVERQVVRKLNRVRAGYGLRALRLANGITDVASAHSRVMARTANFSHGNWLTKVARAARTGTVGEVLAYVFSMPPGQQAGYVVQGWLHSPPHRAIILSGAYHRLGIGRARRGTTTFFTVDVAR